MRSHTHTPTHTHICTHACTNTIIIHTFTYTTIPQNACQGSTYDYSSHIAGNWDANHDPVKTCAQLTNKTKLNKTTHDA